MPPKGTKASRSRQQPLAVEQWPLLKKPLDHVGKQVNVAGSFWQGRQSSDELAAEYRCTILDFAIAHKASEDNPPRSAFKLQEMGIGGTGSLEVGDASGDIFWVVYPKPFLGFY